MVKQGDNAEKPPEKKSDHQKPGDKAQKENTIHTTDQNKVALEHDQNIQSTTSSFTGEHQYSFTLVMNDGTTVSGKNSKGIKDEPVAPPVSHPVRDSDGKWTGVTNYETSGATMPVDIPGPGTAIRNPNGEFTGVTHYRWPGDHPPDQKEHPQTKHEETPHTRKPEHHQTKTHYDETHHHDKHKETNHPKEKDHPTEKPQDKQPTGETPITLQSAFRRGVTCPAMRIDTGNDAADRETLAHFNDTNCHCSTQRKMGVPPSFGAATQINRGWLESQNYEPVRITSNDKLKPGDVVGTPYEQRIPLGPLGTPVARIDDSVALGHSGFVEMDPNTRKLMITEKLGPTLPYVRQDPEAFAQMWTPAGGFADNHDIWVYRRRQ